MPRDVPTTAEVAAWRRLGRHVDGRYVDWASSLIDQGVFTDTICSLAAAKEPFNAFEMAELVDTALAEVGAPVITSPDDAAKTIASIRAGEVLDGHLAARAALAELARLGVDLDHLPALNDFYLLHYAADDLATDAITWHWPSATRETIDAIILQRFRDWLAENPRPG